MADFKNCYNDNVPDSETMRKLRRKNLPRVQGELRLFCVNYPIYDYKYLVGMNIQLLNNLMIVAFSTLRLRAINIWWE